MHHERLSEQQYAHNLLFVNMRYILHIVHHIYTYVHPEKDVTGFEPDICRLSVET